MKGAVLCGLVLASAIQAAPPAPRQVFRSGAQIVFVDVVVTKGRTPVVDLRASEFVLADNGAPQQVEAVADAAIPLDISLVVETTPGSRLYGPGANATNATDVQRSVRQMVTALRPGDRLRLLGFEDRVVERRPMSPVDASTAESISIASTETFTNRNAITQALLTALTVPVAPDRRHLVVLFALGSGKPTVAPAPYLVSAARRADVLLYAVVPPMHKAEITNRPFPYYPSEIVVREAVTQAAEVTGGQVYLTGDIVGAFRDILKQFRSSYVLRYTLAGVPSAGWHDIVVKVPSCATCTIRARRGYMGR
jgi:VWFA-related protein